MGVRVSTKTTVSIGGTSISVGELLKVLQGRDLADTVWFKYSPGDPRDQRDYATVTLEIGKPGY